MAAGTCFRTCYSTWWLPELVGGVGRNLGGVERSSERVREKKGGAERVVGSCGVETEK